jgi:ABC-type oligopeptide transport system substrate-binding subunit
MLNDATGAKYVMILATNRPPTDNKLFRQALQFALNRERIASSVLRRRSTLRATLWRNYASLRCDQRSSLLR